MRHALCLLLLALSAAACSSLTDSFVEVKCTRGSECGSGVCDEQAHRCLPASCADGVKNESEVDVDCGGECSPCADGRVCDAPSDCAGEQCNAGVCGSCTDGLKGGSETDIDCGGTSCSMKCADGKTCGTVSDCSGGECNSGVCGGCSDGLKGGSETDVDCGGGCGCQNGKACSTNADCLDACVNGTCTGTLCQGTAFVILDANYPGLVLDKQTGLEWQRNSSCCYTQPDAAAHCQSLGMRLPTKDEALAITPADSCAWPNGWATWTSTVSGPGRWWYVDFVGGSYVNDGDHDTLCVR